MLNLSNIIIGSDRFKHLNQNQLSKFLDHAYSLGINKIDTAPMYQSEKMIGTYLQSNPNFLIQTKTKFVTTAGKPLHVKDTFRISQENLKSHRIDCLFFHNTPINMISKKDVEEISYLKESGQVSKIGYSGHNFKISDLEKKSNIDSIMITFNALDISDEHLLQFSKYTIHIKRPMANFVFKPNLIKEFKANVKKAFNIHTPIDLQSYQFRFEKMKKPQKTFYKNLIFYLKFTTLFSPNANYIFGVSSISHLNQIINATRILSSDLNDDIINYYTRLKEMHLEYHWKSLP